MSLIINERLPSNEQSRDELPPCFLISCILPPHTVQYTIKHLAQNTSRRKESPVLEKEVVPIYTAVDRGNLLRKQLCGVPSLQILARLVLHQQSVVPCVYSTVLSAACSQLLISCCTAPLHSLYSVVVVQYTCV